MPRVLDSSFDSPASGLIIFYASHIFLVNKLLTIF